MNSLAGVAYAAFLLFVVLRLFRSSASGAADYIVAGRRLTLPAFTASCDQHSHAGLGQIAYFFPGVYIENDSSDGNWYFDILSAPARAILSGSRRAVVGTEAPLVAKLRKRIDASVCYQPDAAAIAAITAVRTSERHVFLTTEADGSAATVAGADSNCGFINEFHDAKGTTYTKRPRTMPGPVQSSIREI